MKWERAEKGVSLLEAQTQSIAVFQVWGYAHCCEDGSALKEKGQYFFGGGYSLYGNDVLPGQPTPDEYSDGRIFLMYA